MKLLRSTGCLSLLTAVAVMGAHVPLASADDAAKADQQQSEQQAADQQQQSEQQDAAQQAANQQGADQQAQQDQQAKIGEDAQAVLDQVRKAYSDLKSLRLEGTLKSSFDSGKEKRQQEQKFTASYQAPNQFRHELADQLIVGSSENALFAYNARSNTFLMADAPDPQAPLKDIPSPVPSILMQQNPSLFMAIEKNPLSGWTDGISSVEKAQDTDVDGKSFTTLKMQGRGNITYTMLIDPQTHLIRRITADLSGAISKRGDSDMKSAEYVIDYTTSEKDAQFPDNHFAWLAPQGAQDVGQGQQAAAKPSDAAQNRPAPDFTLTSLDGEQVKLSDLRGQVVVLDFWASWCPPCREALPHLAKLYQEESEGVKVLAINMGESSEAARSFVQAASLGRLTVLLDEDKSVAEKYGITAIPTTVIVGPDGNIQRTFVGVGQDTFSQVAETVTELRNQQQAVPAAGEESGDKQQDQEEEKSS